jgi:hypothetical protein
MSDEGLSSGGDVTLLDREAEDRVSGTASQRQGPRHTENYPQYPESHSNTLLARQAGSRDLYATPEALCTALS